MHTIIQLHLVSFQFCRKTGCVREQMHGGVLQGRQPKAVCNPLLLLICHGFCPLLSQAFAWRASWVDFCQTWMIIGVLIPIAPGQSPESALLFMFDLPFKFPGRSWLN